MERSATASAGACSRRAPEWLAHLIQPSAWHRHGMEEGGKAGWHNSHEDLRPGSEGLGVGNSRLHGVGVVGACGEREGTWAGEWADLLCANEWREEAEDSVRCRIGCLRGGVACRRGAALRAGWRSRRSEACPANPPSRMAPRNSKTDAINTACQYLMALAPTDVPKAFACRAGRAGAGSLWWRAVCGGGPGLRGRCLHRAHSMQVHAML